MDSPSKKLFRPVMTSIIFGLHSAFHRAIFRVLFYFLGGMRPWRVYGMDWTTPSHEEVCLSCEVSSYANAEL
jgi:hypothetical protein